MAILHLLPASALVLQLTTGGIDTVSQVQYPEAESSFGISSPLLHKAPASASYRCRTNYHKRSDLH